MGARGDDTKSLKPVIIDWITKDQVITPPLLCTLKIDQGFNHDLTGSLLCLTDLDWNDPM